MALVYDLHWHERFNGEMLKIWNHVYPENSEFTAPTRLVPQAPGEVTTWASVTADMPDLLGWYWDRAKRIPRAFDRVTEEPIFEGFKSDQYCYGWSAHMVQTYPQLETMAKFRFQAMVPEIVYIHYARQGFRVP